MRRPDFIARQSREPSGMLGWIIGSIMQHETRELNEVALDALGIEPGDKVLEVGFGHGRTLQRAAALAANGTVDGVELSPTMLRMAERRCRSLIAERRVSLTLSDGETLPFGDATFDKVYSVHTLYFWSDPAKQLREIHRVMRPGGRLALGFRAKGTNKGTDDFTRDVYTFYEAAQVADLMRTSGFTDLRETPESDAGMMVTVASRR